MKNKRPTMGQFASVAIFLAFVFCSWLWTVGLPQLDTYTANVEVNLIQETSVVMNMSARHAGGNIRTKHRHAVPRFMLELFEQNRKQRLLADVVRSVYPRSVASMPPLRGRLQLAGHRRHMLVFDLPVSSPSESLKAVELRLLAMVKQVQGNGQGVEGRVSVSTLSGPELDARHVFLHHDDWLSLDVTPSLRRHRRTLSLVVAVEGSRDREWLEAVVELGLGAERMPLLLLYHSPKDQPIPKVLREKRNLDAEDYEEESNNVWDDEAGRTRTSPAARKARRHRNACRRRPLYVDFSEIEYDSWIVAPDGYEAFQCAGKCFYPLSDHLSPTKHAIVQTLLHSVTPSKASRACCVPTRLEPISVLYLDERGVLTYRFSYHDMVVAECGCR